MMYETRAKYLRCEKVKLPDDPLQPVPDIVRISAGFDLEHPHVALVGSTVLIFQDASLFQELTILERRIFLYL